MKLKLAIALMALVASPALAENFSFVGAFSDPNDVQSFTFEVEIPSTVILKTYSYAGGTNAAGVPIPRGGFDPILALFDSTGLRIAENDDGGSGNVPADSDGQFYDTFLSQTLSAGTYTVSIQAFSNFSIGPNQSNGYRNTGSFTSVGGGPLNVLPRNRNWAFDILNVGRAAQVGAAPEPGTWAMMIAGFGMAGTALRYRRRRTRVTFA